MIYCMVRPMKMVTEITQITEILSLVAKVMTQFMAEMVLILSTVIEN